jgi:hypothetical protein
VRVRWSGRRRWQHERVTPEGLARRGTAEFGPSFAALKEAVHRACAREIRWEARVVAAIGALIEFALEDPAAARALTVCAGALAPEDGDPEGEMLAYFAALLDDAAPGPMLFPISSADGIVETTAILIKGHLLAGRTEELLELGPELVYLTLVPYLGLGEAHQWADTFTSAQGN